MQLKASNLYEAICEAIDSLQRVGLRYIKVDIPNDMLDQFKGLVYCGRPEIEIRYEIPMEDTTSMYLYWE